MQLTTTTTTTTTTTSQTLLFLSPTLAHFQTNNCWQLLRQY